MPFVVTARFVRISANYNKDRSRQHMVQLVLLRLLQLGSSSAAVGSTCIEAPQITVDVHAVSTSLETSSTVTSKKPASFSDKIISICIPVPNDSPSYNMNATYHFKVTFTQHDGTTSEYPLEVDGPLTADQIAKQLPTFRPKFGESFWLLNLSSLRDSVRRQDDVAIFSYSYTRYGFLSDDVYKNCNEVVTQELRTEKTLP